MSSGDDRTPPYTESVIEPSSGSEVITPVPGELEDDFWLRRAPSIDSLPENPLDNVAQPANPPEDPFVIEQPGIVPGIPTLPVELVAPKKHGRPRKNATAIPSSSTSTPVVPLGPTSAITFNTAITVIMPDQATWSRNNKTKTTKVPPKTFGPVEAAIGVTWDEYVSLIRNELQCHNVRQLQVSSFCWHFEGKKGTLLGLQNQAHLDQLFKQLQACKGEKLIVLTMDPPLKVMKWTESLPWAPANPDDQSTGVQPETLLVPT
ncbi:hypothetical protein VKT23_003041 [Stygiomarasmius scandens]|uniref:Uncharacterized protein n=1 Tax=Marasmiellus scandens TaxID=2682957 RepID=A0ABR1JYS5_9AGAR